jgi:membrane-associated phospholipid phosphatase
VIRLPAIISRSPTGLMYFVYWGPFILTYQITNRWPLFEPQVLPFTALDRLIPFVPELLPLYVAYIPLYWWTIVRSEDDRELNRLFWVAHFQLLLSLPFFLFFPVRMPVEQFYPPQALGWADAAWRWFDAPNNCFPSLHVSNCLLLLHFNWRRPHRLLFAAASLGVIASTVLVKQHYVVDVLGGALVYGVSYAFMRRLEISGVRMLNYPAPRAVSS